jgi:hypothetical protein
MCLIAEGAGAVVFAQREPRVSHERASVRACVQMVPSSLPMKQSTVLADYTAAGAGVLSLKVWFPPCRALTAMTTTHLPLLTCMIIINRLISTRVDAARRPCSPKKW